MYGNFPRTFDSLESDRPRLGAWMAIGGMMLTLAALCWGHFGRVAVMLEASSARIEAEGGVQGVQAQVNGTALESRLIAGVRVAPGDTLLRMDLRVDRVELAGLLDRRHALARKRSAVLARVLALAAGLELTPALDVADSTELAARLTEAEINERGAEAGWSRAQRLMADRLLSTAESERLHDELGRRRAATQALRSAAVRSAAESSRRRWSEIASHASARAELAEIEAELAQVASVLEFARIAVSHHSILAPRAGLLARVAQVHEGSRVAAGDTLAWLISTGTPRVVARFAMDAAGRLRPGQRAWVRPRSAEHRIEWSARVRSVASEPDRGELRVELDLPGFDAPGADMGHGSPARVEVEVERVRPWDLLMRSAGLRVYRGGRVRPDHVTS